MLDQPLAMYRVVHPMLWPIPAPADALLVVWPGHDTHTLTVCLDAPRYPILRHAHISDGALYGIIMNLDLDGIIAPLSEADRALLRSA